MADNIVDIPLACPVKFFSAEDFEYPNFDNSPWEAQVPDQNRRAQYSEQDVVYTQKWFNDGTKSDTITIQISATFGPAKIELLDCAGEVVSEFAPVIINDPAVLPGWQVYQWAIIPPTNLPLYYWKLTVGVPGTDPVTDPGTAEYFYSNPQETITSERNTLIFRYKNSYNEFDVIYSQGVEFQFRCEGWLGRFIPRASVSTWEDQPLNLETNKGKPYREYTMNLGQKAGVADFVADIVNRAQCHDYCVINGVQYTRPEDSELTAQGIAGWPLATWSCIIRQTKNRNSIRRQNGNSPADFFFVSYKLDGKLFGPLNAPPSANPITITSVE